MTVNDLTKGRLVQHFKRELLTDEEREHSSEYTYEIIGTAMHTETGEQLVIYRAMYGDKGTYARPVDMFLSEVDREKYPDVKQKYRFEPVRKKLDVDGLYKRGDIVNFIANDGTIKTGVVWSVDIYRSLTEPFKITYDIYVKNDSEECLYKHFDSSLVKKD